jgi:hypothetical protein
MGFCPPPGSTHDHKRSSDPVPLIFVQMNKMSIFLLTANIMSILSLKKNDVDICGGWG